MLPLNVLERRIEPTVITNAIQVASFMFGDVQLLGELKFLERTTSLYFLLMPTGHQGQKVVFHWKV